MRLGRRHGNEAADEGKSTQGSERFTQPSKTKIHDTLP
jgi:hypothetical protein